MPYTETFTMSKLGRITHFETAEDYQCYIKHFKSIRPLLKHLPNGQIKFVVTKRLFRKPTIECVYLTTV